MANEQRHEKVIRALSQDIFSGKLKPGTKLPTERQLTKTVEIDRTSLRIGLKLLEFIGVIDIRAGDGMYVKDFIEHAGLDFLKTVFQMGEVTSEPTMIDDYTVLEAWEFWAAFLPLMLKFAAKRVSPRDGKLLLDIMDEELKAIEDRARVVELNVLEQDMVAVGTKNIVFVMLSNTTRPIRKKLLKQYMDQVGDETLRHHIEIKKALLNEYLSGLSDAETLAQKYEEVLLTSLQIAKHSIMVSPELETLSITAFQWDRLWVQITP